MGRSGRRKAVYMGYLGLARLHSGEPYKAVQLRQCRLSRLSVASLDFATRYIGIRGTNDDLMKR